MESPVNISNRRVTQTQIAQIAGCSQNTVALALRHSHRISETRREQIHRIAERLGYRPNIAARSLVCGRSGLIGLFTCFMDEVRTELIVRLITALHTTEYRPILGVDLSKPSPWYQAAWIESFRDFQVEALICIAWSGNEVTLPDWYKQIPLVLLCNQPDETLPCDYVAIDRLDAGKKATESLLERGHRRIMALAHYPNQVLVQGCHAAMRAAGLAPQFATLNDSILDDPAQLSSFLELFRQPQDRPTAVVVSNAINALRLYKALTQIGVRVPQDITIVGYDRLPLAEYINVPLTTIEQPIDELATHTIDLTRQRLIHPDTPPQHLVLKHQLVVRAST